jgi:hypothetical protein
VVVTSPVNNLHTVVTLYKSRNVQCEKGFPYMPGRIGGGRVEAPLILSYSTKWCVFYGGIERVYR